MWIERGSEILHCLDTLIPEIYSSFTDKTYLKPVAFLGPTSIYP